MGVLDLVHGLFTTAYLRFSRLVYNVCISRRSERYFKPDFIGLFLNTNAMFGTSYTSSNSYNS